MPSGEDAPGSKGFGATARAGAAGVRRSSIARDAAYRRADAKALNKGKSYSFPEDSDEGSGSREGAPSITEAIGSSFLWHSAQPWIK